jgi:hypothetical protein
VSAIFDSLGYVRRLEQAGVDRATAEAHADAARDYILAGVATKGDIEMLRRDLQALEQRLIIKAGAIAAVSVSVIVALERLVQ